MIHAVIDGLNRNLLLSTTESAMSAYCVVPGDPKGCEKISSLDAVIIAISKKLLFLKIKKEKQHREWVCQLVKTRSDSGENNLSFYLFLFL